MMLIHELSGGMWGKMSAMQDDYDNCQLLSKRIKDLYVKHTKLTKNELKNILVHDHLWDSDKCLKSGLVDDII